jgi:structural maintenance of chromosome 2
LDVQFKSPSPDFDRKLVRGRVIRLFTIKEDKYARALEEVAGGKLWSVIVETEAIASTLLKRNAFGRLVTIIPNNKIQSREVPKELLDYVTSVTAGKAIHALQLVKFNLNVENSIRFVFSDAFVCEDTETAKKVAFDPRVRMRCVTLEGDCYSPNGILKGGEEANEGPCILKQVREIQRLEEEKKFSEHKLQEAKNELASI